MNIKFLVPGEVTLVSKSGKTEQIVRVSIGTVWDNVKVTDSEDADCYDIKDGNWTVFGINKLFIQSF